MSLTARQWVGLAAAVFLLNAAFSFHNVWPTPWIELRPELSVEAAVVVLLLAVWHRIIGPPSRRLLAVLAVLVFFMALGRYLEVTAPALYGRGVNLYWDTRYLPDVAAMFAAQVPAWQLIGFTLAALALIAILYWALYRALGQVSFAIPAKRAGPMLKFGAAIMVAAYFFGYYASFATLRWFSIPVAHTYTRQVGFVIDALAGPDALTRLPATDPLVSIEPAALPAGDVLVTFVESYGAVAFDDADLATALSEPRRRFADAIERSGRSVVSAWIEAPTFGGGSWLSHISFMSGIEVNDPATYDALLTQSRPTIPKRFDDAGFRTLALMPGLRNEWPEGAYYGFDAIIGASRLGYAGPEFGWWRIPDQFALAWLAENELDAPRPGETATPQSASAPRAPAFVFFPTISTHAPFRPTPPIQRDWGRLLSSAPFDPPQLAGLSDPSPSLTEMKPAYGDAVAYTYDYWGSFLQASPERAFLLVLVGDHQPPASVSGEGARWDVPVHVVTGDPALLARLQARGFVAGLMPGGASPIARMHELGLLLFE